MNLNQNQIIAIIVGVLSFLMSATAQFTTLFGQQMASDIVSIISILNGMASVVLAVMTGQAGSVKTVLAMPGVAHIDVNANANQTLAKLATDPTVNKIAPLPEAVDAVTKTATGV